MTSELDTIDLFAQQKDRGAPDSKTHRRGLKGQLQQRGRDEMLVVARTGGHQRDALCPLITFSAKKKGRMEQVQELLKEEQNVTPLSTDQEAPPSAADTSFRRRKAQRDWKSVTTSRDAASSANTTSRGSAKTTSARAQRRLVELQEQAAAMHAPARSDELVCVVDGKSEREVRANWNYSHRTHARRHGVKKRYGGGVGGTSPEGPSMGRSATGSTLLRAVKRKELMAWGRSRL